MPHVAISHRRMPKANEKATELFYLINQLQITMCNNILVVLPQTSDLVENLLYANPSGAVHLIGNLAPA